MENDRPLSFQGALDAGDSAPFSSSFLASSFPCAQAESTPAPAPVTQTVGQFIDERVKMRIKISVTALLITIVLAACGSATPARAENFAFVFQDFSCGSIPIRVLDTASGTLVYTPLGDTTSITIPLRLSEDELDSIYQKAMSIGFFEYPTEFVVPDDQVRGYHSPSSSYQLSVTNGEMTNSVAWQDDIMTKPEYKKADQLRELMDLINEVIQSHPEVQELPGPKAQCA